MVINSDLDLEIDQFQPSKIGIFFGNALHYMYVYFRLLSSIVGSLTKIYMQRIPRYLGISKERV